MAIQNEIATKATLNSWVRRLFNKRFQYLLDLFVLALAFAFAYSLRFDFAIPKDEINPGLAQLPLVVLVQFAALNLLGIYTFIWRYVGMSELKPFLAAAFWSSLPILILRLILPEEMHHWRVPVSVIVMDAILGFGGVLGLRVLRRISYEGNVNWLRHKRIDINNGNRKRVLLIGAGRAGMLAAREIMLAAREINGRDRTDLKVEGYVDDDPNKKGSVIQGVRVLGTTQDLQRLVRELRIDHVVISIAQASRQEFRRILDVCEQIPVKVRVIPSLYEILQGNVKVSRIRDVQIEDLLGREQVRLDTDDLGQLLGGKVVMVTGAGGSIGSELARQVARFRPSSLLLAERAEFALFEINRELSKSHPELSIIPLVADTGDEARLRSIFARYHPQVLIHAAAHKHVSMMEINSSEAIKNNVLATHLLGELSGEFGLEVFVLISTDKAVHPKSVMGASKRIAELVVQDLNSRYATRYVAVRFGNVIGSAGSVIPIFRDQIRKGGPVTVTHPDMVRYFMTIPEAAQLVLQAGSFGEGGEIFILDMGEPVRILDLAKETITLSGLKPFEDIDIVFTGMRAGEKLFEELQITEEQMAKTHHPKIFIGKIAAYPERKVHHGLQRLADLSRDGQERDLRKFLNEFLPEAQIDVDKETTSSSSEPERHRVAVA